MKIPKLNVSVIGVVLGSLISFRAEAAPSSPSTWQVTSGTANWNIAANWSPATVPASSVETSLIFNSGSSIYTADDNLGGSLILNQLNFGGSGTSAVTVGTIGSGGTLNFETDSESDLPEIADTSAATVTDSISFTTTNATAVSNTGGATLSLTGAITNNGGITFSGGTVNLGGNQFATATGNITLASGTLLVGANHQMQSDTGSLLLQGGTLASSTATSYTVTNATTIGGAVTIGSSSDAALAFTGSVTINDGASVTIGGASSAGTSNFDNIVLGTGSSGVTFTSDSGQNLTFDGTLSTSSGSENVTFAGPGSVTFLGTAVTNTYGSSSTTTVSSGTTVYLSKSAVHLAIPGNLTINGGTVNQTTSSQIASTSSVVVEGGGTYALSGLTANTTFNTIGTLTLGATSADTATLSFALTATGGTTHGFLADTGTLTIGTSNPITISLAGGTVGDSYDLLSWGSSAGAISLSDFSATAGYTLSLSGDNLDVLYTGATTPTAAYFNGQGNDLNTSGNYDATASSSAALSSLPGSTTNVYFSADRNTSTTPNLSAALTVNSLTFGSGTGTNSGITLSSSNSTTDTLTIMASNANGNTAGNGITVLSGSDTISAPIVLGAAQTWTADGSSSLTVSGSIGDGGDGYALTTAGTGSVTLTGVNTYSGGTIVSSGTLYANNITSSTGTGSVTVNSGGTLSGIGTIAPTGVNGITVNSGGILAPGSGQTAPFTGTPGLEATGNLTVANSAQVTLATGAKLTFSLGASITSSEMVLGSSIVKFSNNVVTINDLVGAGLNLNQEYVLFAGTSLSQYQGDFTYSTTLTSNGYLITGGLSLLAANTSGNFFSDWYGNSELFLTTSGDIDVEVIPEPGIWAMMFGGFALLLVYQRRKSKLS